MEETPDPSPSSSSFPLFEAYTTFVAAFSFLCIGLLRAYTSPAIASMREDPTMFPPTTSEEEVRFITSWVASSPPLASFVGTVIAGPMLQILGRQGMLMALTFPYIVGWLAIGFAGTSVMLIMTGRFLTGLAAGLCTAGAQLYVSECVRAEVRGTLGFLPAMLLAFGILVGFATSTLNLDWRNLALVMTTFPVALLLMTLTVPESPSWLVMKGKEDRAFKSLKRLRGKSNADQAEREIFDMKRAIRATRRASRASIDPATQQVSLFKLIQQRVIYYPAFIAVCLMCFQQFSGANAVVYYLSDILTEAQPHNFKMAVKEYRDLLLQNATEAGEPMTYGMDHNVSSVIVGVVQFLAFFVSLPLIDRLGRRILLICSAAAMSVPLGTLGLFYYCNQAEFFENSVEPGTCASLVESTGTWLPVTCLSVFIAAYSIGFGPICFILMSELFPSKARSYLCALTSFVNHLCLFILIKAFLPSVNILGSHWTFWIFTGCCLVSIPFVLFIVPETKGKTLAEIEKGFAKEAEAHIK